MAKRFSDEFKQNIIDLHRAGLKTVSELSREYEVGTSTIHKWIRADKQLVSTGKTLADIKQMEKEMKCIKEGNEILKKALGLFAQKK